MYGGMGNDTLNGEADDDFIFGEDGNDLSNSQAASHWFYQ
jgi:Ca2+-binding RTX toxin-like protein